MRKIYKIITFLLCLSILILNLNFDCYAETGAQAISSYINLYNQVQSDLDENNPIQGNVLRQFVDNNYKYGMGFLIDYNENVLSDIVSAVRGYSSGGHDFTLPENATDQQVIDSTADYLKNNISVSGNNITYNNNSKNMLLYLADSYVSDTDFLYGLTYDVIPYVSTFPSGTKYQKLCELLDEFQNEYYVGIWDYTNQVGMYKKSDMGLIVSFIDNNNGFCYGGFYNYDTWDNQLSTDNFKYFVWDGSEYSESTYTGAGGNNNYVALNENGQFAGVSNNNIINIVTHNRRDSVSVFKTLASLKEYSVGVMPYYYNNSVYNNFSRSTGDYTVDNSNINTVSYGDVVEYISDYHDTNNNYPDNSVVNNWIENTNEENITNNNGGGSGGDDSGGGSGSGDTNIFDWLKTLGAALGNLIKGVGEFLSEIVAGLVDAVTNLLQAISTLISGVLESLTNIFSGLIEFIYAGLPDDIRNILSLALVVAILITVLKLIRGN